MRTSLLNRRRAYMWGDGETPEASAPTITGQPTISGAEFEGETLTASPASASGYPSPVSTWQWERSGTPISGATSQTYELVSADVGETLTVVQTATNSEGSDTAESEATGTIGAALAAPSITGSPTISGTETEGETLTATAASVTGNPTPTRTWQWERSGTPISGATSATYELVSADVGETLTVVQTETNSEGSDSAESSATGTIAEAGDETPPEVTGLDFTDDTLSFNIDEVSTIAWATADPETDPTFTIGGGWSGTTYNTGSYAAETGANSDALDLSSTPDGSRELTVYAYDASDNLILVSRQAFTLDATAPAFDSAATDSDGDLVTVTFDEDLDAGNDTAGGEWVVEANSTPLTITSAAIASSTTVAIVIDAGDVIENGETVTVSYSGTSLRDAAGNQVGSFTDEAVTNNVPSPGDVTAPSLSSPVDTASGSSAATGSVDTDEGNGTLYWVVTQSGTAPSAAQVKAGNDHTGSAADDSGSQSVSGTGTQTLSPAPSGLTAETGYYIHFMHEDDAENQSTVASGDGFTTAAASAGPYTFALEQTSDGASTTPTTTTSNAMTGLTEGNWLFGIMVERGGTGTAPVTFSDNHGGTWTKVQDLDCHIANASYRSSGSLWKHQVTATDAASGITISAGNGVNDYKELFAIEVSCDGTFGMVTVDTAGAASAASDGSMNSTGSGNTSSIGSGDLFVLAWGFTREGSNTTTSMTFTGYTDVTTLNTPATNRFAMSFGFQFAGQSSGVKSTTVTLSGGSDAEGGVGIVAFKAS